MGAYGRLQRFVAVTVLLVWTLTGSSAFDTMWKMPIACVGTPMTALGNAVVIFRAKKFAHFPYLEGQEVKNGGIPQKVNMKAHLEDVKRNVEAAIPDFGFYGPAMIVLDAWHPIYDANTKNTAYRTQSEELVRKEQPTLTGLELPDRARSAFEDSARKLLLETLKVCKDLRPNAKWGFFGLPTCSFFDKSEAGDLEWCKESQRERNDQLAYLMKESKGLFPSIQATWGKLVGWRKGVRSEIPITSEHTSVHARAVLNETSRFNTDRKPVFSYIRVEEGVMPSEKTPYLNLDDICKAAATAYSGGAQDTLMWVERGCDEAKQFVASILADDAKQVKAVQKTCPEVSCWRTDGACA